MDDILRVECLKKRFGGGGAPGPGRPATTAVDGVTFGVGEGETLVLAGESGSGKSTVARMILGAVRPDSGRILLSGREVRGDRRGLRDIRMQCQMIQQDPYDSLNPRMTVSQIVSEPLEIHGGSGDGIRRRVLEVLREVRLEPALEVAGKHPHMLSGGQRQRVAVARALAPGPRIIIADEPVSMLDVSVRAEMLELMGQLQARHRISFIYITHDLATARHFGSRIAVMYLGKIVETGGMDDVLLRPRHPYTQALVDAISEPDPGNLHRRRRIRIGGPRGGGIGGGCAFRARCPYAVSRCATAEPGLEPAGPGREVSCFVPVG